MRVGKFSHPKARRLLNSNDFSRVFKDAKFKASHPQCLILANPNLSDNPRLGIVVSKKNVRLAVSRNRIKRLIRESFRLKQQHLHSIDAIVLARRGIDELNNQQITEILNGLWKRINAKAKKGLDGTSSRS